MTPRPPAITYRPTHETRRRLTAYADAQRWSLAIAIDELVIQGLNAQDAEDARAQKILNDRERKAAANG